MSGSRAEMMQHKVHEEHLSQRCKEYTSKERVRYQVEQQLL